MATRIHPHLGRAEALCHALSDQTRLQILDRLRARERCVCELTADLDVAQSRLSFHLRVLKDVGLVTDRREGRWMYYALNPGAVDEIGALVAWLSAAPGAESDSGCC